MNHSRRKLQQNSFDIHGVATPTDIEMPYQHIINDQTCINPVRDWLDSSRQENANVSDSENQCSRCKRECKSVFDPTNVRNLCYRAPSSAQRVSSLSEADVAPQGHRPELLSASCNRQEEPAQFQGSPRLNAQFSLGYRPPVLSPQGEPSYRVPHCSDNESVDSDSPLIEHRLQQAVVSLQARQAPSSASSESSDSSTEQNACRTPRHQRRTSQSNAIGRRSCHPPSPDGPLSASKALHSNPMHQTEPNSGTRTSYKISSC
ncbi:hypothetical protein QAD02_017983 [Eretmocerus hayati]|uniref:Uncharacterized protein n=1 Tax=Eretmocerus hayati TaxID=131215 RepID=A0ACC2PFD7_9HYME|nr:hypothetical protein QAD02_017983 [Eretmocerus hayati]